MNDHVLSSGPSVPCGTVRLGLDSGPKWEEQDSARPVHVPQLRAVQHNLLRGCWALCFIRKQNISFPHH